MSPPSRGLPEATRSAGERPTLYLYIPLLYFDLILEFISISYLFTPFWGM